MVRFNILGRVTTSWTYGICVLPAATIRSATGGSPAATVGSAAAVTTQLVSSGVDQGPKLLNEISLKLNLRLNLTENRNRVEIKL